MASLTSLSFAYPSVPSARRAQLSLPGSGLDRAHGRLHSRGHQAFLLSTCLRVEIAWTGGLDTAPEILACLYGEESSRDLGVARTDEAAFVHLCRVAAGLDSPLIGEPEILGQFRHAVAASHEAAPVSGELGRVLEAAIGIGRNTRRLLGDAPRGSMAALAVSAAAPLGMVAILGAGAMARAAAELLDARRVTIFARRPEPVAGHHPRAWGEAAGALANYPVVISTVPGKVPLFTAESVSSALERRTEPLLLIDLGMPPGFARPEPGDPVRYLGVDDLAAAANAHHPAAAEASVVKAAAAAWRRLSLPDRAGVVIAALIQQAETAVSAEVPRFAQRLSGASDPERVLSQLAHTVARRVLHSPISFIGSSERGVEAVEVLAEAFGIDDD